MKWGRKKWPLPARVDATRMLSVLRGGARTPEVRAELRAYLMHFREARDIYRHNARECAKTVEAIEAALGEFNA